MSDATTPQPIWTRWWMWPVYAVAAFVAWALLRTPSPEQEAKANARQAIALCWQEQERKSLDPASARFVAGACEEMERKFQLRFGVRP